MRPDPHSFADDAQPEVTALDWRARVDFASRTLEAEARLTLADGRGGPLDLDTRDLAVSAVTDDGGRALAWEVGPPEPILGARLRVELPAGTQALRVAYRTSPQASALQWLSPEQTAGGAAPFLYSQCQAIHARSVVPLPDTPRVRIRYRAELTVPPGVEALMAAGFVGREPRGGEVCFRFAMDEPIPPYLFAFAVGQLASRDLGPRTRVWAEPPVLERAAFEFASVGDMLDAAERLFGPYPWGRFDLLTMPPAFPYGGMENPRLTFLTPTLLAGDRSLVGVVAHELAHSWTGNLVTSASAEHFWLNEGWTVFAERRIVEALAGPERAALEAALGRRSLDRALADLRARPELTKLRMHLAGVHPDDAFSVVPYEKGYLLLRALEEAVGRAAFDRFIACYIERFRFQSLTTEAFVDFVRAELPEARVDLQAWLDGPGVPADAPAPRSIRLEAVQALFGRVPTEAEGRALSPVEWQLWLEAQPRPAPQETLRLADGRFQLTDSANYEVLIAWLELAARSGWAPAIARAETVLGEVGRMKYLKPLYVALASNAATRDQAGQLYRRYRERYHPIARQVIESVLRQHRVPTHDVNAVTLRRPT